MAKTPDDVLDQTLKDYHERLLWVLHYLLDGFDDKTYTRFARAADRLYEQVRANAGKQTAKASLHPALEASRRRVCG